MQEPTSEITDVFDQYDESGALIPKKYEPPEGFGLVDSLEDTYGTLRKLKNQQTGEEYSVYFAKNPESLLRRDIGAYDITDFDAQAVRHGLEVLGEYLHDKSADELPTQVLFAETSARPLAHAVNPVLKAIYESKNAKFPNTAFFKSEAHLSNLAQERPDFQQEAQKEQAMMRARAAEVINLQQITAESRLLVIDDHSNPSRGTATFLRQAFRANIPDLSIAFFAFLGEPTTNDAEKDVLVAGRDTRQKPHQLPPGFDFRTDSAVKANVTGVDKKADSGKISEKLLPRVLQAPEIEKSNVIRFRHQLRQIGEEVAKSYK